MTTTVDLVWLEIFQRKLIVKIFVLTNYKQNDFNAKVFLHCSQFLNYPYPLKPKVLLNTSVVSWTSAASELSTKMIKLLYLFMIKILCI